MVVATVGFCFVSCGDDDDNDPKQVDEKTTTPIIGTWTWIEHEGEYSFSEKYAFKSDGTFTLVWQEQEYSGEESGLWKYDTNDYKLTLTTIVGEKPGSYTYTVILQGKQMTLIEADGDVCGPYTKQ